MPRFKNGGGSGVRTRGGKAAGLKKTTKKKQTENKMRYKSSAKMLKKLGNAWAGTPDKMSLNIIQPEVYEICPQFILEPRRAQKVATTPVVLAVRPHLLPLFVGELLAPEDLDRGRPEVGIRVPDPDGPRLAWCNFFDESENRQTT